MHVLYGWSTGVGRYVRYVCTMVRIIHTSHIISECDVRLVEILDHKCAQGKLAWSVCHLPTYWWEILVVCLEMTLILMCEGHRAMGAYLFHEEGRGTCIIISWGGGRGACLVDFLLWLLMFACFAWYCKDNANNNRQLNQPYCFSSVHRAEWQC